MSEMDDESSIADFLAEIPLPEQRELKRAYKKGEKSPQGYLATHDWMRAQMLHGLRQARCACNLYLFPQERADHKCKPKMGNP